MSCVTVLHFARDLVWVSIIRPLQLYRESPGLRTPPGHGPADACEPSWPSRPCDPRAPAPYGYPVHPLHKTALSMLLGAISMACCGGLAAMAGLTAIKLPACVYSATYSEQIIKLESPRPKCQGLSSSFLRLSVSVTRARVAHSLLWDILVFRHAILEFKSHPNLLFKYPRQESNLRPAV